MADLPDWAARWLERQSHAVDAVQAVAPFDRVPKTWLIRVLHAAALLALLALGVLANSVYVWTLVAIPMTVVVVLGLSGRSRMRVASPVEGRPGPFDAQAMGWSVLEPSFDSPIVVARRTEPPRVPEPLILRRSR